MTAPRLAVAGAGRPHAPLTAAAVAVFAGVLPLAMVVANRSSAAVLLLAALLGLLALWLGRSLPRPALRRTGLFGLFAALSIAWALLSMAWAPHLPGSARQALEAGIPLLAIAAAALALDQQRYRAGAVIWAACALGAAALVVADLQGGLVLRRLLAVREQTFVYNRTVVSLLLTSWPLVALLLIQRRRALLAALLAGLLAAILVSDSQTALLAGLVGLLAFVIARMQPLLASRLGLAAVLLVLVGAPWIATVAEALTHTGSTVLKQAHAGERIAIWRAFAEVVTLSPLVGHGFGASAALPDAAVTQVLSPATREALRQVHPHNAFLQIWVELGAVGVFLIWMALVGVFRQVERLPRTLQAPAFGLLASALTVAAVSHGAWQAWWLASLGAGALGFILLARGEAPANAEGLP
jgi:O-antigen ligase